MVLALLALAFWNYRHLSDPVGKCGGRNLLDVASRRWRCHGGDGGDLPSRLGKTHAVRAAARQRRGWHWQIRASLT